MKPAFLPIALVAAGLAFAIQNASAQEPRVDPVVMGPTSVTQQSASRSGVTIDGSRQRIIMPDGDTRMVNTPDVTVYSGTTGVSAISGSTRIAPRDAYLQRQGVATRVPQGYKRAWDDDRLNPKRAHQTLAGRDQMNLIWSNTVPRVLVDRKTGAVVTEYYPHLKYPYTSTQDQKAAEAAAISTRSTPREVRSYAASHRFVQVGVYTPDAAKRPVRRLQRQGFAVKIGKFTQEGREAHAVLLGPFETQSALEEARFRAQELGFSDARLRK